MKNCIVYYLSFGIRCGYNGDTNRFEDSSTDNATRYTEIEALKIRDSILEPFIVEYQSTGRNYREIYSGKIK